MFGLVRFTVGVSVSARRTDPYSKLTTGGVRNENYSSRFPDGVQKTWGEEVGWMGAWVVWCVGVVSVCVCGGGRRGGGILSAFNKLGRDDIKL